MVRAKKVILPLFIAGLMVFSIFGFAIVNSFSSPSQIDRIEYNGYSFTYDGTIWTTYNSNGDKIEFLFDPRFIVAVYTGDLIPKIFNHKKIYLSVDPDENLAQETQYFRQILQATANAQIVNSCPLDKTGCEQLPIKNCQDAILGEVLVLKLENGENSVQEGESCIALIGDSLYFAQIVEKIRLEALL